MSTIITTPDFPFSGNYYPEILEDLIQYMRQNLPELTDEDDSEPWIQLLRAYALAAHVNNVLADLVAKEGYLAPAQLRASVLRLLELIGYQLAQASPASADEILKLSGPITTSPTEIMAAKAVVSTRATSQIAAIEYENLEAKSVSRTDELTSVQSYDESTSTYTDHTIAAKTPSSFWTPWSGGAAAGDLLYFGHSNVFWDILSLEINTAGSGITGIWEYYDGNLSLASPDSVTNLGSTLKIVIDSLLGTSERTGAVVRVMSNLTGVYEDLTSQWDGSNNYVETTGFLGQATPSVIASDYTIGSAWRELENLIDGTSDWSNTGSQEVSYDFPQDITHNWRATTVNAITALWIRYRIISVSTPTSPIVDTAGIEDGNLYALTQVTQGISREDNPLASSTGLQDQRYQLSNLPVIDDATLKVYVTEAAVETEWVRVDNFLSSNSVDIHFRVEFGDDGEAIIVFGDGINGKIPQAGVDNIRATYRSMDELDGNVGALEIDQNQSGSSFVSNVWNPRPAVGYQPREGSTPEDLERSKALGVASVRTGWTASSPEEIETLTLAYQDDTGARPFVRAYAIEEAYGPKTIGVVVVGAGGGAATQDQLDDLELYFNGNREFNLYGVLVSNHQVVAENWIPQVVNITATVYGGNKESVETILTSLITPIAVDDDGDWVWEFGGEVPTSRIIAEIFKSTPTPRKVDLTVPASDISLGQKELPSAGVFSITIVP